MSSPRVTKPAYKACNDNPFGPATIEHRTADSGLSELGTYFMNFATTGESDPWTLQYEETIFVIDGKASIVVLEDGHEETFTAAGGELVVLPKGTTVRYGGTADTRLLLSIAPVNWRDRTSY